MNGDRKKILIADDDKEIRSLLQEILSDEGYDAQVASDGIKAIEAIKNGDFDIVITDLIMPGADGLEVLKQSQSKNKDTLVLIITGFATIESTIEAAKSGAYDYLTKPFLIEEIKLLVRKGFEFLFFKRKCQELEQNIKKIESERDTLKREITVLKGEVSKARELGELSPKPTEISLPSNIKRMSDVSQAYLKNFYARKEKIIKELEQLGNMWLNGNISDEEFKSKREKILSAAS